MAHLANQKPNQSQPPRGECSVRSRGRPQVIADEAAYGRFVGLGSPPPDAAVGDGPERARPVIAALDRAHDACDVLLAPAYCVMRNRMTPHVAGRRDRNASSPKSLSRVTRTRSSATARARITASATAGHRILYRKYIMPGIAELADRGRGTIPHSRRIAFLLASDRSGIELFIGENGGRRPGTPIRPHGRGGCTP